MTNMTFIPAKTIMLRADSRVILDFPTEDDAILFVELMRDIFHGKHGHVTLSLSMSEGESYGTQNS